MRIYCRPTGEPDIASSPQTHEELGNLVSPEASRESAEDGLSPFVERAPQHVSERKTDPVHTLRGKTPHPTTLFHAVREFRQAQAGLQAQLDAFRGTTGLNVEMLARLIEDSDKQRDESALRMIDILDSGLKLSFCDQNQYRLAAEQGRNRTFSSLDRLEVNLQALSCVVQDNSKQTSVHHSEIAGLHKHFRDAENSSERGGFKYKAHDFCTEGVHRGC